MTPADKLEALAWVLVTVGLALGCFVGVVLAAWTQIGCVP